MDKRPKLDKRFRYVPILLVILLDLHLATQIFIPVSGFSTGNLALATVLYLEAILYFIGGLIALVSMLIVVQILK